MTLQTCKCQVAHHSGLHGFSPLDSPTESHRRCKSVLTSALRMPPSHRRALNTAACTADALHMEAFCSSYSSGRSTSSVRRGLKGERPLHTCAGLQLGAWRLTAGSFSVALAGLTAVYRPCRCSSCRACGCPLRLTATWAVVRPVYLERCTFWASSVT